ncbi:calcium/sodium antiporter [archaeon]|jgi:cation:H+ antiporter|nr:calcium/sodium antiporter [archaeon]MBT4397172.1 calcium/sodium antiporter [archaeon]MBT4440552.1 calcium/sodium antiporter [archaeon]
MLEYLFLIIGIIILVAGAHFLIKGATSLAKLLRVPSLVIGLTVVAFGTSMPELFINIWAASQGASQIGLGNVVGSNLINTLLILGMTSLIYSIRVKKSTVWKEIPFSLLAGVVLLVLANDFILDSQVSFLSRVDGVILLLFFFLFIYYTYELATKREANIKADFIVFPNYVVALMLLGGSISLFIGGKLVVDNAITIATNLGLSQFIISATILAVGTSLPELVTSIVAALEKKVDLAVGDIVGSNIFNIFLVLGVSSIITPIAIPNYINFDFIAIIVATAILFAFAIWGKKRKLLRWQGAVLVMLYIVYLMMIIIRG